MGQDNTAEEKINKVSGVAGQPMESQGPELPIKWSLVKKTYRLPMENFRRAVSAPVATIKNGVAGFLFSADAEIIYIQFCVPPDWDGQSDLNIILHCILNQAETVNDLIDWETSTVALADHENVIGAPVQTPGVAHDIGNVNGDGAFHKVPLILVYNDGTCPIAHGDNVSITLSRTANIGAAGYVGAVLVIDICLEYQANKLGEVIP